MYKTSFTPIEYELLKKLISKKILATTSEQKVIRSKIRDIGFSFSMFSSKKGYTVSDLENLKKQGLIKISPENQDLDKKERKISQNKIDINSPQPQETAVEINPFKHETFKKVDGLDPDLLRQSGLYAIRLNPETALPPQYATYLPSNRILYIGKAQNLGNRLAQEIYHTQPGTFFRSIGAVLQFRPIPSHLKGKGNQYNYKFKKTDNSKIIAWLKNNVEISLFPTHYFTLEADLIKEYRPLLNQNHNCNICPPFLEDRRKCLSIARDGM